MRRDGQFYMLDAFIASTILFIGVSALLANYVFVIDHDQTLSLNQDIADILFTTDLGDITNSYTVANSAYFHSDWSAAEQIHVWHKNTTFDGCTTCESNTTALLTSILDDLVPVTHGMNISVVDDSGSTLLYTRPLDTDISLLVVNKHIVISNLNQTDYLGPDFIEVRLWY